MEENRKTPFLQKGPGLRSAGHACWQSQSAAAEQPGCWVRLGSAALASRDWQCGIRPGRRSATKMQELQSYIDRLLSCLTMTKERRGERHL